jgi:glycine oxidase
MNRQQNSTPQKRGCETVVVGGGVVGLSVAFELHRRGADVVVVEAAVPGGGTTRVAGGMLAPVGELDFGEGALLELSLTSAGLYPGFVERIEAAADSEIGYRRPGALHVALDRDEAAELKRALELQLAHGFNSRWLGPGASRELEPGLSPGLNGSILVEGDGVVDPRALSSALLSALENEGVPVLTGTAVTGLTTDGSRASGVVLADGSVFAANAVVAAIGAESGRCSWLPEADRPPVRPVKGQVLELRGDPEDPVCSRILASERVYLVPRTDGRLIVGATVEEMGYDRTVTAGGIHELLREAYRLLPDVAELGFVEATVGLRPGTPDNLPVIGHASTEGLILATGHYRNGILLAPVTARAVADLVEAGEPLGGPIAAASPARFRETGTG